jgi:primosomal protein N' (replication factor Y) (superfamily II helicase)
MNSIAKIVVELPLDGPFDYAVPAEWRERISVGMRAAVSFGRRRMTGFVVGLQDTADVPHVKPLDALLDAVPVLDGCALALTREMSLYYGCSWGEAIGVFLPPYLRKPTPTPPTTEGSPCGTTEGDRRESPRESPCGRGVGVEGSCTLVVSSDETKIQDLIITHLREIIKQHQSAIVLFPEANRIKAVTKEFEKAGLPAVCYHGLPRKKEFEIWDRLRQGEARVVVGTRSAVFAPVRALGLMIITDEDLPAYEQEQSPHYHSVGVAHMRCRTQRADLLLISPAPRAETWARAREQNWTMVVPDRPQPKPQLVDMTSFRGKALLSYPLQSGLNDILRKQEKAVLVINRRGFAGRTACGKCGYVVRCPRCDINLTYLYSTKKLTCGRCKYSTALPKICPQCQTDYLRSTGAGIEKLESELARMYPQACIAVYDRDTEKFPKQADIIVGTQAVLRWRREFRAALVALLDFDAEMNRFDFRSGQKAFALVRRLQGMAGERMLVQTFMPDNAAVRIAAQADIESFYRKELEIRKELGLPPYQALIELIIRGESEKDVFEQGRLLFEKLKEKSGEDFAVSDLHPDVIAKSRDQYRYAIVGKGAKITGLLAIAKRAIKEAKRKRSVIITVRVEE